MHPDWIQLNWKAPANVRGVSTTRVGGVSAGAYASLNLGDHVGDDPGAVAENRRRLCEAIGAAREPRWLKQVHGKRVARLNGNPVTEPADAAVTDLRGEVCAIMTADCVPVLFCDEAGTVVGAAHAGWRGLAAGVLEATLDEMNVPPSKVLAWIGPAIAPIAYEVGDEVREIFKIYDPEAKGFTPAGAPGKWLCDLYFLVNQRLQEAGVTAWFGGPFSTYSDSEQFFSHRRDGQCGRMATLIWLAS